MKNNNVWEKKGKDEKRKNKRKIKIYKWIKIRKKSRRNKKEKEKTRNKNRSWETNAHEKFQNIWSVEGQKFTCSIHKREGRLVFKTSLMGNKNSQSPTMRAMHVIFS